MANDNNIGNFTASDIEKYHRGQLSAREMHAMEKAALDDPFLADALEGYSVQGVNVNSDIAELKRRLADKTEQAKVIPIHGSRRSSFPWLRAAIMVILIAGAGTLTYQFLFKADNKSDIAQSPAAEKKNASEPAATLPGTDSKDTSLKDVVVNNTSAENGKAEPEIKQEEVPVTNLTVNDKRPDDSLTHQWRIATKDAPATSAPATVLTEKEKLKEADFFGRQKNEAAGGKDSAVTKVETKTFDLNKPDPKGKFADDNFSYKSRSEGVVNGDVSRKRAVSDYAKTNLFRGRVTDPSNNALPFANITNRVDNVGTYSDAQGYFTLVSPDSVLDVQVRSLGFENSNVQLRGVTAGNNVIMQEDRSLSAFVVDTVKRNFRRVPANTLTFEEPEPEDGWGAYRNYVVNNLNVPETFDMKKSGETADNTVEVSFDVNKNGEPINIKVEKSLCDKCDKEAIRLIKEGPKWKRKAKKGKRTTVAVPFIKP